MKKPFRKKKKEDKFSEDLIKDSYSDLKVTVDKLMDSTESRRTEMTKRLNEYRNNVWDEGEVGSHESKISFNFLFAVVATISALLTDSKPKAKIVPLFPYLNGPVSEAYNSSLDYVWDKLELQDMIYKTVVWASVTSLGIAEIGYSKGEGCYGLYYEMVDPRDFFVAPGYEDVWDAPFCGVRENVPVSKVKAMFPDAEIDSQVMFGLKDEKVKKSDEGLKYTDAKDNFIQSQVGLIQWYKVWMRTDELLVKEDNEEVKRFPNGVTVYFTDDTYLGYVENEYMHGKPPYVVLTDYYNPGMFDSISEGDQIWSITKEINIQLKEMMERARRQSNPSVLVDTANGIDVEQIKQDMQSGKTGQVYAYSSTMNTSGRPTVETLLPREGDNTAWQIISSFKGIVEYILGYTDMLRGEVGKSERQSAVEVSILSEASSVRIRPKIRNLEKYIKRMTHLYICLMQQYWKGEHWMYNTTDKGEEYFNFSSTRTSINDMLVPDKEALRELLELTEEALTEPLAEAKYEEFKDYLRFAEWANDEGYAPEDGVMFPFEIEVESDSTLPMDRQSKANLMLRLYSMKAVDRRALLETLEIPNWKEIDRRLSKLDGLKTTGNNKPKGA